MFERWEDEEFQDLMKSLSYKTLQEKTVGALDTFSEYQKFMDISFRYREHMYCAGGYTYALYFNKPFDTFSDVDIYFTSKKLFRKFIEDLKYAYSSNRVYFYESPAAVTIDFHSNKNIQVIKGYKQGLHYNDFDLENSKFVSTFPFEEPEYKGSLQNPSELREYVKVSKNYKIESIFDIKRIFKYVNNKELLIHPSDYDSVIGFFKKDINNQKFTPKLYEDNGIQLSDEEKYDKLFWVFKEILRYSTVQDFNEHLINNFDQLNEDFIKYFIETDLSNIYSIINHTNKQLKLKCQEIYPEYFI